MVSSAQLRAVRPLAPENSGRDAKCRSERSGTMSESFDSWHSWHPNFFN